MLQLAGVLQIRSHHKIKEFLHQQHVGRIATLDKDGFPQIIPMNFVFQNDVVYMHSHTRGEKLDNIVRNERVGFEVDRELEFLPSYFEDPHDASLADTLYISVVIKGNACITTDRNEKALALNGLMKKYQPEGRYDQISSSMKILDAVAIIKIVPSTIHGKYKIGQHLPPQDRLRLAQKILKRNSPSARQTIDIMGFKLTEDGLEMSDGTAW